MLLQNFKSDFRFQRTLAGIEDVQGYLDDHLLKTQTMRGSPYFKAFESKFANLCARKMFGHYG